MKSKYLINESVKLSYKKGGKTITSGVVKKLSKDDNKKQYLELKGSTKKYYIDKITIQFIIL